MITRACVLIVLATTVPALGAATDSKVSGRVQFLASTGTVYALPGVGIDLFAPPQSTNSKYHTSADGRGFFRFGAVGFDVYRLQITGNGRIEGGTIVRVHNELTAVPAILVDLSDPCLAYYGRGYATDYIRTRTDIPWRADSKAWFDYAARVHWSTGSTPKPGTIAVFDWSPTGHVAWVEAVTPSRTFDVSQWNDPSSKNTDAKCSVREKFGVLTRTRWSFGDARIKGFITPR